MSQNIIKSLEELNSEIQKNLLEIENLSTTKGLLETKRSNLVQEVHDEKNSLVSEQVIQENLSDRNEEVRRKFSVLDVIVKNDGDKISEEMKSLIKMLNVKTSVYDSQHENYLEVKLEFPETIDSYVTFTYDPATNDYELSSMSPPHQHFEEMKGFLHSTGDIQGFLSTYRKYAMSFKAQ